MPTINDAHWSPTGPPRSELPGAGGTLRQIVVKAGQVAARHHHDFEQFLFVASGTGTLQCEKGSISLAPGTALHLEPGAWHSAQFTTETVLIEMNLEQRAA